ncbi:MAG: efflux RND transporter periplasmic adaptor subunit, partial [Burkholderiaceae bacterium]
ERCDAGPYIADLNCSGTTLSHGAPLSNVQPLLRDMARAMDESLDQAAYVALPQHPDDRPRVTRAHAALAQRHGMGSLLTVPLFADAQPIAALVFERSAGQLFDTAWALQVQNLASGLAPALRLLIEQERGVCSRAAAAWSRRWQALPPPRRRLCLAALPVAALLLTGLMLTPWQHDIAAPTQLEGRIQRAVVAPLDGYLKAVHVRAGDSVVAGQLLIELADDDLRLELRRRQTEVAQHEGAYGDAMARQDRSALVQAEARAAEARAQLGLIQAQLERTRIVAPFDALVIMGDLSQQLAAPLRRGELLFKLTPTRELRVMLQVDERDSERVRPGMQGAVTFAALPDKRYDLVLERVSPVARSDPGHLGFEAEARLLAAAPELMRPGMQGLAQLNAGQQPLYWLLSHRVLDWLRLQWWRWVG